MHLCDKLHHEQELACEALHRGLVREHADHAEPVKSRGAAQLNARSLGTPQAHSAQPTNFRVLTPIVGFDEPRTLGLALRGVAWCGKPATPHDGHHLIAKRVGFVFVVAITVPVRQANKDAKLQTNKHTNQRKQTNPQASQQTNKQTCQRYRQQHVAAKARGNLWRTFQEGNIRTEQSNSPGTYSGVLRGYPHRTV